MQSLWHNINLKFPTIHENLKTDVCVVGAGIAGLTIGYLLQKEGKSVVILEKNTKIAAGNTGQTTAQLSNVLDEGIKELERIYGMEKTNLIVDSHTQAIDLIEKIVIEENIACNFERVDGYLVALNQEQQREFAPENEAVNRIFKNTTTKDNLDLKNVQISCPTICFPRQAVFDIDSYMQGLAQAFIRHGGQIFCASAMKKIKDTCVTTNNDFEVQAEYVVIATNAPIYDKTKAYFKQAAYRTHAIAFEVTKNTFDNFLLWDMQEPYHYVRLVKRQEIDYLVVGGEDYKTGQSNNLEDYYQKLEQWSRKYFKNLGKIAYSWSGQVMEPADYLAFIGESEDNIYIATGDSGHGMTHATIAGILITDLIKKRQNIWQEIYTPKRLGLKNPKKLVQENLNTTACMVKNWLKPSEVDSIEDIMPGEGAILREGLLKSAVFRDNGGNVYKHSAICTHLGCIVNWNSDEKSWDCPCHGARFDSVTGEVLNGPAIKPLTRY